MPHILSTKTPAICPNLNPYQISPCPCLHWPPHLLGRIMQDTVRAQQRNTRVNSTIHADLQQQVSDIIERHHQVLKANHINNIAAVVLDVETGATLAYAGNIYHPEDPSLESSVDVINAPRSPGSTLKPLLYAAMLHDGLILPNSLMPDIPTQIAGYQPQNFDLGYDGAVPAAKALARSLNVPAVKMLQKYKYERFYDLLKKAGITTLKQPAIGDFDLYALTDDTDKPASAARF